MGQAVATEVPGPSSGQLHGQHGARGSHGAPRSDAQPRVTRNPVNADSAIMSKMKSALSPWGRRIEDVCTWEGGRGGVLGKGSFATVWKARLKETGKQVAVKVMEKDALRRLNVPPSAVTSEVELMRECNSQERFVHLYDFLEGTSKYYIVLEFCSGGNLQDAAMSEQGQHVRETEIRCLMKQMLEAIAFLHGRNICHRDVKPHNFLVSGNIMDSSARIKLADFGIAVRFEPGKLMKQQVGTPAFMSPELHLLPRRSPGYDCKVDIWAVGIVMVFLLAAEYPFVDGNGRLLRDELVRGDLPIWEESSFAGLFQGFQERMGMRKKRPSKTARKLIRQLVDPRRETRLSATAALRHDWFHLPIQADDGGDDDLPLFRKEDFEQGMKFLEQSAVWAMQAADRMGDHISAVPVSGFEPPSNVDMNDERVTTCVVCYESSGNFGYLCPACKYATCMRCLQKLRKPICPHCRQENPDFALARSVAQSVERAAQEGQKLKEHAIAGVVGFGSGAIDGVGNVAIDSGVSFAMSGEQIQRRGKCFTCNEPSNATNYCCPCCSTTVCWTCTKRDLTKTMRCPACFESGRNKRCLEHYLAAGETIAAAREMAVGIYSDVSSGVTGAVSGMSEPPLRRLSTLSDGIDAVSRHVSRHGESIAAVSVGDDLPILPDAARLRQCGLCNVASSWSDHVCPRCSTVLCSQCICSRLSSDPRCPNCKDRDSNIRAMQFIIKSQEARDLVGKLWSLGTEMFSGGAPQEQLPPPMDTLPGAPMDTLPCAFGSDPHAAHTSAATTAAARQRPSTTEGCSHRIDDQDTESPSLPPSKGRHGPTLWTGARLGPDGMPVEEPLPPVNSSSHRMERRSSI